MDLFHYGLAHWILYGATIYYFGFIYGVLFIVAVYNLLHYILPPLGYGVITSSDIMPALDHPPSIQNNAAILEIEKLKFEELKEYIYKRGILNIRRLRQKVIRPFGFWFFKDVDPEEAKRSIKLFECKRGDNPFKSEQEAIEFLQTWSQEKIPEDKVQWEILVIENYTKETSLVFWKAHHVISDGIGLVMLIAYMNDEIKHDTLVKPSFGFGALNCLLFPYYFMKMGKLSGQITSDPNQRLMKLTPCVQTHKKTLHFTKSYKMQDLRKAYGKYPGMKLNDFFTGNMSTAFKEYFAANGDEKVTRMKCFLAVNIRNPSDFKGKPEDVIFGNINGPVPFQFQVSDDLKETMENHKAQFKEMLDPNMIGMNMICERIFTSFSDWFIEKIFSVLADFDLAITNVAGPKNHMVLMNKKLLKIIPFANTVGVSGLTVLYFSYLDEIRIYCIKDSNLPLDVGQYLKVVEKHIDKSLASS